MKKETIEIMCKNDGDVLRLLDLMKAGAPLVEEQREALYAAVVKKFKSDRLHRFCNENFVLLVVGLLLALSWVAVLVTGYDDSMVLVYLCCVFNLVLCNITIGRSLKKFQFWLDIDKSKEMKE